MPTTADITKKALDALHVSQDIFINVAKEVLDMAKSSEMGAVPFFFGTSEETKRHAGTIYVIPAAKRRVAFPVFWDTEPKKYLFPKLFQALDGPSWADSFNALIDPNTGSVQLDKSLLVSGGESNTELPDLIDDYLKERFPDKGLVLLYRPLFSSVDRFRLLLVEKEDQAEDITKFVKELYGFYPQTDVPMSMLTKAVDGLPDGFGIPETDKQGVKIAKASDSVMKATVLRYVAAENVKDAKTKLRLYTTYSNASDHAEDKTWPIFRVSIVEGEPDWKNAREVHSVAEDVATKMASRDPWLRSMETREALKLATNLKKAMTSNGQQVII